MWRALVGDQQPMDGYTLFILDIRTAMRYDVVQAEGEDVEDAAHRFIRELPADQRCFHAIVLDVVRSWVGQG
jgi:hypothetical protein